MESPDYGAETSESPDLTFHTLLGNLRRAP